MSILLGFAPSYWNRKERFCFFSAKNWSVCLFHETYIQSIGTHLLAFERLADNPIRKCIRNSRCTLRRGRTTTPKGNNGSGNWSATDYSRAYTDTRFLSLIYTT